MRIHLMNCCRPVVFACLLGACAALAACATAPTTFRIAEATPALQADVPHLHVPRAGLLTGGQPGETAWRDLRASGVTRVINLRPASELADRDEGAEVRASGIDYVAIDVAGSGDLTDGNASRLWQSLQVNDGTVLVHCASGNRAGALLALAAAHVGGMSPQAALEFGKASGLSKLEPVVRERLGLPALASQPERCAASASNC